jgi:NAD-dependent deacetylase
VLWFDECYDEPRYRAESALAIAGQAAFLVVIGTSGATNLPRQVAQHAARRGVPLLVLDPEPNPFTELAAAVARGWFVPGRAGTAVPALADVLCRVAAGP